MYGSNYPGGDQRGGYPQGGGMPQPGDMPPGGVGYPQTGGGGGFGAPGGPPLGFNVDAAPMCGPGMPQAGGGGMYPNAGFDQGAYNQPSGQPQFQGGYGGPQPGGYGAPPQPGGYGAPQQQGGYGAPQQQGGYGAPQPGGYGAPSQPGGYGAPPQQGGYGAPQQQGGYGAPQPGGYGAPPQQGGYGAPPQQGGYGAPQSGGYGAPTQPGHGAPPAHGGFGQSGQHQYNPAAGVTPGFAAPPAKYSYGHASSNMAHQYKVYKSPALESIHYGPGGELFRGTIHPDPNFNPERDVEVLRKAMKGIGTDEAAIIGVVGKRTNQQRQEIKKMFKVMVGKDLIKELKGELSGHFKELVVALFHESTYYDAYSLRESMKGAGTREGVLIEILTTRTNEEIKAIKEHYKMPADDDAANIQRNLEKDVESETSGFFRRVLISCLQANRNELNAQQMELLRTQGVQAIVDYNLAKEEARQLYNAGEKKVGTDEQTFIRILGLRNIYQLRATFEEYQKIANKDILKSIDSEMSGDLRKAMKSLALSAINRPLYFATRLQKSMKGAGTNDSALIRIVVSRSEIDLQNIKEEFQKKYGKPLQSWIRGDTSGDYKKLLDLLIGN